jgi:hypothetical protein
MRAQVLLYEVAYSDEPDPRWDHVPLSDGWTDVPFQSTGKCAHIVSACVECVEDWRVNYEIRFVGRPMERHDGTPCIEL